MATKKLTKEELKTPDFFVSHGHQMAEFILKYKGIFIFVIVAGLASGTAWVSMHYWQNHVEKSASTAIYPAERAILKDVEKNKTVSDANLNEYEKVLVQNASSRSALASLITLTPELIKAGKAAVAAKWFTELTLRPGPDEIHFGLMKMTQGLLALEVHQPDQALGFYQEILSKDGQKSFHADALLKSGVAYQMKNDMAKAREMFEKVHREHPTTQAGELAFQYLLYLDQKSGA